jgi:predicted amidohydrolase YtcJ
VPSELGQADLVLVEAAVHTVDRRRPRAEAVAITGGRIAAVGSNEDVRDLIAPGTRVLELPGRMVLPGFQDVHIHAPHAGLARSRCWLHDADSVTEYVEEVRRYADGHSDAPWIVGEGWAMDAFPSGIAFSQALDVVVPDRPAYLASRDGHSAWVNSRALEQAGVTRDTPDPVDGRVERDADGEPAGTLQEGAMRLVERLLPGTTAAEWEAAILSAQSYLHSLGVTAWQDAHVSAETQAAYMALADRGELTARVVGALWWDRYRGDEQVEELVQRRAEGAIGRPLCPAVKIMLDGVCENFTAAMLEPYLDASGGSTDNRGTSFVEPSALARAVTLLDRERFQVHFHAIGDRAVREALDACEAALRANGRRDSRHHIAHIQVIHPDDVPRFAELGVVADAQPYWAVLDGYMRDLTIPFLGRERSGRQYPFASLLRSGARLAMGSDWSVSTPDPLLEIEVAVTRVDPEDRTAESFLPDERLTLGQAIEAFTLGSAFVNRLDDVTGTIERGKAADLVVLDRDLFGPDAGPVGEAKQLLTLVQGEVVFADPSIGW